MTAERRVRVELDPGYDVIVGPGVLDQLGKVATPGCRAFMICDDGLPAEVVQRAEASLKAAKLTPIVTRIHAAEPEKSIATLQRLLTEMARHKLERSDLVVALGGGLTGDVAGFAAATYRRGLPFIQCPTTLLAMVDASVGGKTGVNLELAPGDLKKNMVGAFHQPRAVLADVGVLASLPDRTFRAGLAECLKHSMLSADFGDPVLQDWMVRERDSILLRNADTLAELVHRNVTVKAAVVGCDEREEDPAGGRALLNLGHTFGHAIETLPGLAPQGQRPPLEHGEAVALGLIAAAHCASAAGLCPPEIPADFDQLIRRFRLPVRIGGLPDNDRILTLMSHDKKSLGGRLRLILPTAKGRARVVEAPPASAIAAGLDAIRA